MTLSASVLFPRSSKTSPNKCRTLSGKHFTPLSFNCSCAISTFAIACQFDFQNLDISMHSLTMLCKSSSSKSSCPPFCCVIFQAAFSFSCNCSSETEPVHSPERWLPAPMSRSTWWRKSTNGDDNRCPNMNCDVSQLLPKELEEHKTINNKDGMEQSLHAVWAFCQAYVWERKIQNETSIRGHVT